MSQAPLPLLDTPVSGMPIEQEFSFCQALRKVWEEALVGLKISTLHPLPKMKNSKPEARSPKPKPPDPIARSSQMESLRLV